MDTFRKQVIQKDAEIAKLTLRVNGLEEEGSNVAKNLEDVLTTNDALILENSRLNDKVSSLELTLIEKEKQINIHSQQHNLPQLSVADNAVHNKSSLSKCKCIVVILSTYTVSRIAIVLIISRD